MPERLADAWRPFGYEGAAAVVSSALVPQWRSRIAASFAFPEKP